MPAFPPVHSAVLEYRRGEENLALRIEFATPLTPMQAGNVILTVGIIVKNSELVCESRFPRDHIVVLQPLGNQGEIHQDDYKDMVQHFGYNPKDALPIVGEGQISSTDHQELIVVAPGGDYIH